MKLILSSHNVTLTEAIEAHILAKLDVSDRTEAAVYASQLGLLNT